MTSARPLDVNLNVAVGASAGSLTFREYRQCPGLSTLKPKQAHATAAHIDYEVEVVTLSSIFDQYVSRHVDFLKIDVEGFALQVFEGADWTRHRPAIVCAEADYVSAIAWAFAAAYGTMSAVGRIAPVLETLMIEPAPRRCIASPMNAHNRNGPLRLTAMTLSQSSSVTVVRPS